MKIKILFIALIVSFVGHSQFSKTHYIPPLSSSSNVEPQEQYLYISSPSITPVTVQIQEIGGATITGLVSRDAPYVYDIGFGFNTQLMIDQANVSNIQNNKGYIVQGGDLIYVTVRLTATPQQNHAGGLVAKGNAALGTHFRIGAFVNTSVPSITSSHYTFASILATENNTTIAFDDIKTGASLINNTAAGNNPANIMLNAGESYAIAVDGTTLANADALIGASIISDKPIAVNCGSFAGSNGTTQNLDLGFDQIVSAERTGKEYIFIKGNGVDEIERPLLVINEDGTDIFLNGSTTPANPTPLNAGQYFVMDGSYFSSNNNLYVQTNKNVFAFQGIGGSSSQANQNMHFLPPLSCQTPKVINNIPKINEVGDSTSFEGTVCIVTETGASLNFIIDGINYTLATLSTIVTTNGPLTVTGNPNYVTYTFEGLNGNISVFSDKQLYLSYFGSSGAATYGGFYSGFTFNPEIVFQSLTAGSSGCLPNVELNVSALSGFDTFQWYYNGVQIPAATSNVYQPTNPGYYKVEATLTACGFTLSSNDIPVSNCADDFDNDGINNNFDLDIDNDGITNCNESFGDSLINTAVASGTIAINSYTNAYTATVTTSSTASTTPFIGNADGSFVTDIPAGKTNFVEYTLNFAQPITIALDYVNTANATDLINANAEYIISSPINKTITVINPNNQLLIDTNYDGIFESNVTQFSSFEIRFRLNNTVPLPPSTGTFKFITYMATAITIKHRNLLNSDPNKSTFKIYAACIPKDYDNDGVPDAIDLDSDNDGILDYYEAQGATFIPLSNIDVNQDGIDDAFGTGITPNDFDGDGIYNIFDLDSDNDGIFDVIESGSASNSTNTTGTVAGSFGTNGLANSLETSADNGVINYTMANTDAIAGFNFISLDSDNDGCTDVKEAGFQDANNDGILDSTTSLPNTNGTVQSTSGYTVPNQSYILAAPIVITTQPNNTTVCENQTATFTVVATNINNYQWQISIDNGITWANISNNITYSGSTTSSLVINNAQPSMVGYLYRVFMDRLNNICGAFSSPATFTTYALPVLTATTLIQCDDNTDGLSYFNLTVKNDTISANATQETFTYFTSQTAAQNNNITFKISNPLAYYSNTTTVWVRVENANGCVNTIALRLIVSVTQIPASFSIAEFVKCDDAISGSATDGIAQFNFSSAQAQILTVLPAGTFIIKYYKNQADALSESNAITNPSNYSNVGYPNYQEIWVRVDNGIDNSCFGLQPYIKLRVSPLPKINTNSTGFDDVIICSDNPLFTTTLNAAIIDGSPQSNCTYQWYLNNAPLAGQTQYAITVSVEGTYSVEVKNADGCPSIRIIKVEASEVATIQEININDLVDNNWVEVVATGSGNYQYSLNLPNGPFQSSPLFTNVDMGIHTVYVNDINGCGTIKQIIAVMGIPKYFTPNGDGYNDFWAIKGANKLFNNDIDITIFDRYGKLIYKFTPSSIGWDGKYNGQLLTADDFWYVIKVADGRVVKGHFSLQR